MTDELICDHIEIEPGKWKCPICTHEIKTSRKPKNRKCGLRPPSLLTQAANAARAIAKAAKNSFAQVPLAEVERRLTICNTCDQFDKKHGRCNQCGCYTKFKAVLESESCPLGKWTTGGPSGIMRVLLIAPCLHNPGGIERWLIGMTRYIPEVSNGQVQITGVVIRYPKDADPKMHAELSRYARVVLYQDTDYSKSLVQSLARNAGVIVASGVSQIDSLIAGSVCPVVFVSHSCCSYSERLSRDAFSGGRVTHWASVGHQALGVFPDQVVNQVSIVENGAEIERCTPVKGRAWQRQQWGVTATQRVIGFVGRLHDEKRPLALAEAVSNLPVEYVGIAYGSGIHERDIIAESRRIAGNRVRFLGVANHLGDILAGMDIGLHASPAEGFCLVRTEMQLAGLPIVSTPTGEIPRLEAEHGKLTHRIPVGASGEVIADVIQSVVKNRIETSLVADRAKELAWHQYTAAAMAGRWVNYLQSIVK